MAEVTFVLEFLTEVVAGVTVLTALAGIALSMTLFLRLGRLPSRTRSPAASPSLSADPSPTQLKVLKDSILWVRSLRSGKGRRAWSGPVSNPPAG